MDTHPFLDQMLNAGKFSKDDKHDLRSLLIKLLAADKINWSAATMVCGIARFHKNWRDILIEDNIIEFFSNKALTNMFDLAKQVKKDGRLSKNLDFEADFIAFVAIEFIEIYNNSIGTKARLKIFFG